MAGSRVSRGSASGVRGSGDPAHHVEPWRDTGLAIEGPAIADIDRAFADTWAMAGAPIPAGELPDRASIAPVGDVLMRVVASTPATGHLYRLDQLITADARRSLWLTVLLHSSYKPRPLVGPRRHRTKERSQPRCRGHTVVR